MWSSSISTSPNTESDRDRSKTIVPATAEHPTAAAVVRKALELLREQAIGEMYEIAWRQWVEDGEDKIWDLTVGDGLKAEDWSAERGSRPQPTA